MSSTGSRMPGGDRAANWERAMAHRKDVAGKWRKRFLAAMARTANAGLSARMAGVDRTTAFALRKRDPGFASAWIRARDWGRARVKAQGRPVFAGGRPRSAGPDETLDPRPLRCVRRRQREGARSSGRGRPAVARRATGSSSRMLAAGSRRKALGGASGLLGRTRSMPRRHRSTRSSRRAGRTPGTQASPATTCC